MPLLICNKDYYNIESELWCNALRMLAYGYPLLFHWEDLLDAFKNLAFARISFEKHCIMRPLRSLWKPVRTGLTRLLSPCLEKRRKAHRPLEEPTTFRLKVRPTPVPGFSVGASVVVCIVTRRPPPIPSTSTISIQHEKSYALSLQSL